MGRYAAYTFAFFINALVVAAISSVSIEMRFAINHTPNVHVSSLHTLLEKMFYYLRIIPYKFSSFFKLTTKDNHIPEWVKLSYTFIITFIIAISIYHLFLTILGYNNLYKYFFGNFADPKVKR